MRKGTGNERRPTKSRFFLFAALVLPLLGAASAAPAQTTGAQLVKQPKPVYPEAASKGLRQGNVNLIGRIDTSGKIQDIRFVHATVEAFIDPAVAAVKTWELRPATRGGKPVEIAANVALRFRLEGQKHGEISSPMLGDLAVFPADASGRSKAPEGFPIRRGADPRVRVEAVLDVSPDPKPRNIPLAVEAISPRSRQILLHEELVSVKPRAADVKITFTPAVGADWEDGVWLLRFRVDKADAGGGQFWIAGDPERFHFVLPGKAVQASAPPAQANPPAAPHPKPSPSARKTTK